MRSSDRGRIPGSVTVPVTVYVLPTVDNVYMRSQIVVVPTHLN